MARSRELNVGYQTTSCSINLARQLPRVKLYLRAEEGSLYLLDCLSEVIIFRPSIWLLQANSRPRAQFRSGGKSGKKFLNDFIRIQSDIEKEEFKAHERVSWMCGFGVKIMFFNSFSVSHFVTQKSESFTEGPKPKGKKMHGGRKFSCLAGAEDEWKPQIEMKMLRRLGFSLNKFSTSRNVFERSKKKIMNKNSRRA